MYQPVTKNDGGASYPSVNGSTIRNLAMFNYSGNLTLWRGTISNGDTTTGRGSLLTVTVGASNFKNEYMGE